MESTNISLLNVFYKIDSGESKLAADLIALINASIENKKSKTLAIGFCGNFLDSLYVDDLYYAIPSCYPQLRWPSIRPFRTVAVDETALPFSPNTWDCFLALHLLEFSAHSRRFLREAFRTTKMGGKLIVVAVNKKNGNYFQCNRKIFKRVVKHTVHDIIEMITLESFSVTDILGINERFRFWPYNFSYNLDWYGEILLNNFPLLADVVIIVAEKGRELPEPVKSLEAKYEIL
ncbi:MAG: class I SAM-dependent methyltransferase [Holosporaceae bacterium]|jgi:SAM-dependent methyltransferase|nr:class I SAM-dependent methyltransferase [Holosporaceae bacterium]